MLLSLLIIAIAMALFSVKLIFKKNGKFSSRDFTTILVCARWVSTVWLTKTAKRAKQTRRIKSF